jgi:hypothetical protein
MASPAHLERLQARLERLHHTVQADLEALPTLTPEPILSDSDSTGGVALDSLQTPGDQSAADAVQPDNTPSAPQPNPDRRYVWLPDAESSYNPTASPVPLANTATLPPSTPLLCPDLNRGDLGSATKHYCPIVALSRYPYRWCDKADSQDIASAFFDQGKFWEREWDL